MRPLLLGSLLAALVLFVWGFLVWGLMPVNPFDRAGDERALTQALLAHLPATGTYLLPHEGDTPAEFEAATAAMRRGPLAMVFFRREGVEPMSPVIFALGFLHMLATTLLVALALRAVAPALPRFGQRAGLVALFALAFALWARMGEPIWWHHPADFYALYFVSDAVGWALAGLVLARFVRRAEPERVRLAMA